MLPGPPGRPACRCVHICPSGHPKILLRTYSDPGDGTTDTAVVSWGWVPGGFRAIAHLRLDRSVPSSGAGQLFSSPAIPSVLSNPERWRPTPLAQPTRSYLYETLLWEPPLYSIQYLRPHYHTCDRHFPAGYDVPGVVMPQQSLPLHSTPH